MAAKIKKSTLAETPVELRRLHDDNEKRAHWKLWAPI